MITRQFVTIDQLPTHTLAAIARGTRRDAYITPERAQRELDERVQLVGMPYPVKCSADELTRASVEVSR